MWLKCSCFVELSKGLGLPRFSSPMLFMTPFHLPIHPSSQECVLGLLQLASTFLLCVELLSSYLTSMWLWDPTINSICGFLPQFFSWPLHPPKARLCHVLRSWLTLLSPPTLHSSYLQEPYQLSVTSCVCCLQEAYSGPFFILPGEKTLTCMGL